MDPATDTTNAIDSLRIFTSFIAKPDIFLYFNNSIYFSFMNNFQITYKTQL